jgi:uncharacterized protein (DUF1810 family)
MTDASADSYDLNRFVSAQEQGRTYDAVLAELRAGRKRSHWMWFVFPQIIGLGRSPMAQRYAIRHTDEARAYVDHPVLGSRLNECCELLLTHAGRSAEDIFGSIDAMKLRSSMTLFEAAAPQLRTFRQVLDAFFAGDADSATLAILSG